MRLNYFDIILTSLCWARHIWYVYSHSHHLYSSSQKMQQNLWGLFTALSKSQNYALRFSHRVHERSCVRRCARRTQSHPPSKSIRIHVSIKMEHLKTRARETSWKACGRYSEMCKIKSNRHCSHWAVLHPFDRFISTVQHQSQHVVSLLYKSSVNMYSVTHWHTESLWLCFSRLLSCFRSLLFQNAN